MLVTHLEKLPHFVGAVRAGSIRGYAMQQRLSQPAVSKSIQGLEAALETALILRTREGIEPTPQGRELLRFAEDLLEGASHVEGKIHAYGRVRLTGQLVLGTYQSIAVYFLPRFYRFLRQRQGELSISFKCASSADLLRSLRAGSVDAVVSVDPPMSPELTHTAVFEDTFSLYGKVGIFGSLGEYPVFTLPAAKDSRGKSVLEYLDGSRLRDSVVPCGDFESVKAMVEEGVGWGFMPDRVASPLVAVGRIARVPGSRRMGLDQVGRHSIAFSCRKGRSADVAIDWVRTQLLAMLNS